MADSPDSLQSPAPQPTPKPQTMSLSVVIVDPGPTICEADIDVEFTKSTDSGATLTLAADSKGCTVSITDPVRHIDEMLNSGVETFTVAASSCSNGTAVTLTAKIEQGSSSNSNSRTLTVDCA